jgi:hypothetical protein
MEEKSKGCIFYTDLRPKKFILDYCRETLKKNCPYPIVSVSLHAPIDLGKNIVLEGRERSYPTMLTQIVMALEALDTDIVFFLEHDVLYNPTHFDFIPPTDYIYYYNINNYRWSVKENFAVTYDGLHSLSALCCYRKLALEHFKARLKYVEDRGWDKERSREPRWGRVMGYEPGTKPRRRGGFSDETFEVWKSELPNLDIRHRHTFSSPKTSLSDFKHPPTNWKEVKLEDVPYWHVEELSALWRGQYLHQLISW